MRRVIYIVLILIAACAGTMVLARQIGQAHALPLAAIFTRPDGTPCAEVCLFGAVPGKTGYQETMLLLKQHPLTRSLRRRETGNELLSIFESKDGDFNILIARSQGNTALAWMILMNVNPDLTQASATTGTLGEMVSLIGPPSVVEVSVSAVTIAYYAASRIELVSVRSVDSPVLSLTDAVSSIRLWAPGQSGDAEKVRDPQFKAWAGFAPLENYQHAPSIPFTP